jgi:hypothetical protein
MRELPSQSDLNKPRDHAPIVVVPPQTWNCLFCDPSHEWRATTVEWVGPNVDGPDGRCRECGQKYVLARESRFKLRAGMPSIRAVQGSMHCPFCSPDAPPGTPPTVSWSGPRGTCARCGQGYLADAA